MELGSAEKVLAGFLLEGAFPCAKTPLCVSLTTHRQLKPTASTKASAFIGTLFSGGPGMLCSHLVADSCFFLPEYHICDVQMCWYSISTPQRLSNKGDEQDSSLAKERVSIF